MKKLFVLAFAIAITFSVSAQKIKVKEANENIGGGSHNSITVTLYDISPSDAVDAFRSFIKKYDGKRSSLDGGVFSDNATIKDMGNNTIDIYGKAQGKKGDPEITFVIAFDLGGAFLNSSDHKEQYKTAEKIAKEFAINTCKEIVEQKLKDAQRKQSGFEDEQKDLEKENRSLTSDIEDYKAKIKKAEDNIVTNKSNQEKKKAEIETQKKAVSEVETKLKSIE
ncbi:MAG: hypothetical protein A3F72_20580 [Bacteroidetes bacterium RIFCSPLOWO2_12_FULL_35_15]|nr:MAG: hypothetical protein A3F72_20580 [Bacteroidetes bacterium RIFCSPLOWO2_12_FULL_35_15]